MATFDQGDQDAVVEQLAADGVSTAVPEGAPAVAEGVDADRPMAVEYRGNWETLEDGLCEAVRRHALALSRTGLPVVLQSFDRTVRRASGISEPALEGNLDERVWRACEPLLRTSARAMHPRVRHRIVRTRDDVEGCVISPRALEEIVSRDGIAAADELLQRLASGTVVLSVWERDRIDQDVAHALSRVWNWVPCEANRRALVASGVPPERVLVVPHPVLLDSLVLRMRERPRLPPPWRPLVDAPRRFYTLGKWEPRKRLPELLEGFLRAFRPGDGATLTIKTTDGDWRGYGAARELLQQVVDLPAVRARGWTDEALAAHVIVITRRLQQQHVDKLHFVHNLYVCASQSEGFALPAFDASCAGNRVVYVAGGGGPEDYAREGDVAIEPDGSERLHASYEWGAAEGPRVTPERIAAALVRATPPELPRRLEDDWWARFGEAGVGAVMREELLRVAEEAVPDARRQLLEGWS